MMRLSTAAIPLVAALFMGLLLPSGPARVGLMGTTITLNYNFLAPAASTDGTLVTPGVEVTCTGGGSGIAGLDLSRISFTSSSVSVDLHGLSLGTGNGFTLTLVTVPEPASLAILAQGVLGLAGVRRTG